MPSKANPMDAAGPPSQTRPSSSDPFGLTDRVAVVTGGSAGLGRQAAIGMAEAGAHVVLVGRRADRLSETQDLIHAQDRRSITVAGDIADPETARRVVDATLTEFGRVDTLLNCAGIGTAVPATRETPEEFRRVQEINLHGSYWMAQACAGVMEPGSSITNVSSLLGLATAGLPQAAYAASKSGIIGLTRDLAAQWTGRLGIRVNAVAPGFFVTEMTDQYPEGYLDTVLQRVPAGRPGRAEEFAAAVVFLASDAASYITGETLRVDGGAMS